MVLLGGWLLLRRQNFRVDLRQLGVLLITGLLYTSSSLFLFMAYRYVASGLATTLVFLAPVFVAIIMVFLGKTPSWPVWLAIAATFAGVVIMTGGDEGAAIDAHGVWLAIASALAYAIFMVIINHNRRIADISDTLLTFYVLTVGAFVFLGIAAWSGNSLTAHLDNTRAILSLTGLAVLPTIVSTATLAVATRNIGATKASILEVFEPITAILVGAVAFGEPLTPGIIAGISIAIVAVTFMIYATRR